MQHTGAMDLGPIQLFNQLIIQFYGRMSSSIGFESGNW